MRRLLTRTVSTLALSATAFVAPVASAELAWSNSTDRYVDIAEVSGALDRIEADFLQRSVKGADADPQVELLVIQLNSARATLDRASLSAVIDTINDADVPIAVWIGPGKARAAHEAVAIAEAADVISIGEGASIGPWKDADTPELRRARLSRAEAKKAGLVDVDGPVLGELIVGLDGTTVDGHLLDTAEVVRTTEGPRQQPTVVPRFTKPSLGARWLHNAASPAVTYLLLLIGLVLIAFEFFSLGVGVAAAIGALCVVVAGFGLADNSIRPWALALLVLGVLGYCIDSQAGAPRTWTGIGTAASIVGTFGLFTSASLPWLAVALGLVGTWLACVSGFSSMSRSRFATPTVGRESMIGREGHVVSDLGPDGVVSIDGALWRARIGRPTPLTTGAAVVVVAISGLILEVEPHDTSPA